MKIHQPVPGKINQNVPFDITNKNSYANISLSKCIARNVSIRGGFSLGSNRNDLIVDDELEIESKSRSLHLKGVIDHDLSEHILLKYGFEWTLVKFDEH